MKFMPYSITNSKIDPIPNIYEYFSNKKNRIITMLHVLFFVGSIFVIQDPY
jgi:hypothetical protein